MPSTSNDRRGCGNVHGNKIYQNIVFRDSFNAKRSIELKNSIYFAKSLLKKRIRCDFIDMKAGLVYATKIHKTEIWRSYLSVILTRTTCPSVLGLQPECFQSSSIKISTFALRAMFLVRFPFCPQEMLPDFVCLKTFLTCRLFSERKYLISLIKNCRRK